MSTNNVQQRQVAQHVFARELSQSTFQFKESDAEMAPNYVLLPSGEKANRIVMIGTLTDTEQKSGQWMAEITDPTGKAYVYASDQYQTEIHDRISQLTVPEYVVVIGKPNVFGSEEEGGKKVSIRPESLYTIDEAFRHVWVGKTAEHTLDRIENLRENRDSLSGVTDPYEQYGEETVNSMRDMVVEALEQLQMDMEDAPQS